MLGSLNIGSNSCESRRPLLSSVQRGWSLTQPHSTRKIGSQESKGYSHNTRKSPETGCIGACIVYIIPHNSSLYAVKVALALCLFYTHCAPLDTPHILRVIKPLRRLGSLDLAWIPGVGRFPYTPSAKVKGRKKSTYCGHVRRPRKSPKFCGYS